MALDMADAEYAPDLVQHTPGIQNVIPDVLSRKYDPHRQYLFPVLLHHAKHVDPFPRTMPWWRAEHMLR